MSEMEEEKIQDQNNHQQQQEQPHQQDVNTDLHPLPSPPPPATVNLIDTVTIIPPDSQRCRRNSGHSGWRCKNLSADNNLQYCQQHYDSRKNNPPKKKKKKLIESDYSPSPISNSISSPIKLKIRRRRDVVDLDFGSSGGGGVGGGCSRSGGGGSESADCCSEKRRRKTKKVDCPCCVEPRVSFSLDCFQKEHLRVELGDCVDLNVNHPPEAITHEPVTVAAAAAVVTPTANDLGFGSSGRNMEKVDVPPDELRCRRNDGVNWRCKNYWSSDNDLRYCDKHYTTRVIGLRRKSNSRKTTPRNVEWGIQTKSIANDLDLKVELASEDEISAKQIDSKVEFESEDKSVDGNHVMEEDKPADVIIEGDKPAEVIEEDKPADVIEGNKPAYLIEGNKPVESENKENGDAGAGDLGNGGGVEESNGNVPKVENEVVQEIKKKKKKKIKKSKRCEGGGNGKSESQIKDKKKKKRKREREIHSISGLGTRVIDSAKPRKVMEGDRSVNEIAIQHVRSVSDAAIQEATCDSDGVLEAFAEIAMKKQKVETTKKMELKRCSGEVKSTKSKERMVEMEKSLQHYKRKWLEMSVELEKKKMECVEVQGKLVDVESRKVVADDEFKKYKRLRRKKDERAQETITYLEGKIKMIEKDLEHGKSKAEDETEYWRKKFCDLESRVLKMENGNSTSEKIESEVRGVQSEVTDNDKNQCDKSTTDEPNAETSGGRNASHVAELQTEKKLLNGHGIDINKYPEAEPALPEHSALNISSCGGKKVEEGKGADWEERKSQHGTSFQIHLEMNKKPSVNGVSDSGGETVGQSLLEDSNTCTSDSKNSSGDVMDKSAIKYRTRDKYKLINWEIEADMISSFDEDAELCMRAVCALFRLQRSEENVSADWLFHYSDALSRGSTLAEFLMDGDRRGDLKKTVEELDVFDGKAREDCKRLAKSYSKQLFRIYQNKEDPFFPS
ncbi:uncharacterized protein LOC113319867 isoform X1 [Papaver somniferum]|uniref:uncharacterized protein LOC113319867 isoform X1 n=1 Tax=Papaver somniferum TaxID=3469 RepID=UPI000E701EC9|nr:uncharacterized protein LOC113319867 isoform X1 [Papaver somniferum]